MTVAALGDALTDSKGIASGGPDRTRWSVTVAVLSVTIELAGSYAVELVVEAANAVGMPPSDIAAVEILTIEERYRRNV
ncbi:MAG: hypothetical protein QOI54_1215 [Actinomycetota bacterium]|nr:hypothetical protein [Actinomycetota bacterium]